MYVCNTGFVERHSKSQNLLSTKLLNNRHSQKLFIAKSEKLTRVPVSINQFPKNILPKKFFSLVISRQEFKKVFLVLKVDRISAIPFPLRARQS